VGPSKTLGELHSSRGRVAEWPVADPILRVLVLTQENALAKSIARMRRENREDAGRFDRTRPAVKRGLAVRRFFSFAPFVSFVVKLFFSPAVAVAASSSSPRSACG
jgi:hypothetical protein